MWVPILHGCWTTHWYSGPLVQQFRNKIGHCSFYILNARLSVFAIIALGFLLFIKDLQISAFFIRKNSRYLFATTKIGSEPLLTTARLELFIFSQGPDFFQQLAQSVLHILDIAQTKFFPYLNSFSFSWNEKAFSIDI